MLKHFGGFVMGITVGILIISITLVGGGYLLLTKEGMMKTVEENVGASVGMDLNEEQEQLSLLDYGMSILEIFGNLSDTPIKDIENTVGINKISTTISDAVGIEAGVIGESSISNLGATLADNLTMNIMQDKFEVELPDLPMFNDEEFLSKPMNEAFGDLDQNTLDGFIEVVYDEDATEENPASSALLQKLGKKTLKEVSEDMDAIIQDTAIGEVVDITEESAEVMQYLKDTKIGELDGAIKDMKISDAIAIDENSSEVMKYLKDKKLDELDGAIKEMKIKDAITIHFEDDPENGIKKSSKVLIYLQDSTLEEIDENIKAMTIGDAIDIDENSSRVLRYLQNSKLDELDADIKEMTLSDTVDIYLEDDPENGIKKSSKVLIYLKDCKIDELNAEIEKMTIADAVEITEDSHPVMKAISDLTLNQLGEKGELQTRINGLMLKDVVEIDEEDENTPKILLALKDSYVGDLSEDMDKLTIEQVMDDSDSGIFSLIPSDTRIQDVGSASSDAVTDTSLYALRAVGIFEYSLKADKYSFLELIARINKNNGTPDEIINDFTKGDMSSGNITLDQSITHSVYLTKDGTVNNATFKATAEMQLGYEGIGVSNDVVALNSIDGITINANGAYVLSPEVVHNIANLANIGANHSIVFYVDQGIDLEIQAGQTDGVYDNYDILFSVMYDVNNAVDQGTLYFGSGIRSENAMGGCAVYVADNIKVLDGESNYVDYDFVSALPITFKMVKKNSTSPLEPNTWAQAYNAYDSLI